MNRREFAALGVRAVAALGMLGFGPKDLPEEPRPSVWDEPIETPRWAELAVGSAGDVLMTTHNHGYDQAIWGQCTYYTTNAYEVASLVQDEQT